MSWFRVALVACVLFGCEDDPTCEGDPNCLDLTEDPVQDAAVCKEGEPCFDFNAMDASVTPQDAASDALSCADAPACIDLRGDAS